jgi:hypothetical protein
MALIDNIYLPLIVIHANTHRNQEVLIDESKMKCIIRSSTRLSVVNENHIFEKMGLTEIRPDELG